MEQIFLGVKRGPMQRALENASYKLQSLYRSKLFEGGKKEHGKRVYIGRLVLGAILVM